MASDGTQLNNINLVIPAIGTVIGTGTVSPSGALDFKMAAKLNNNASLVGGLQRLAGLGQVNKPIPFRIQGTTQNPVFMPDVGGMIGNTVTAPAKGVQGGIGGILGIFQKKKQQ